MPVDGICLAKSVSISSIVPPGLGVRSSSNLVDDKVTQQLVAAWRRRSAVIHIDIQAKNSR